MSHITSEVKIAFSGSTSSATGKRSLDRKHLAWGSVVFVALLAGFWAAAKRNPVGALPYFPASFVCFGLMFAWLWYSGFGLAHWFAERIPSLMGRVVLGSALAIPYLISSVPAGQFRWQYLLLLAALPAGLSALVGFRRLPQRLTWQDAVALGVIACVMMTHALSGAWPTRGLGSFPKLYLTDAAIYVFLVVRRVEGVGYSLVPTRSAFRSGAREWLLFAPIGIGLGLLLHFITFYPRVHNPIQGFATYAGIFLLIAIPEELFFRGILQNLLESSVGRARALLIASVLFGLSHFPKGAVFNWRYVLLATIAGVFYGRAWRAQRQLFASSITHAGVDTVWTLWFR